MSSRRCIGCGETLPFERFPHRRRLNGDKVPRRFCYQCVWVKKKESLRGTRENFLRHAKARYGLTEKQVDALLIRSSGLCEACGQQFRNTKSEPHIDHSHQTGKVRGLLCTRCNLIAGTLEKELRRVKSVLAYLRRTK